MYDTAEQIQMPKLLPNMYFDFAGGFPFVGKSKWWPDFTNCQTLRSFHQMDIIIIVEKFSQFSDTHTHTVDVVVCLGGFLYSLAAGG